MKVFGNVLLVEATGQSDGQQTSYVFKSIDGGATWRYVVAGPSDLALITFVTESRWLQFVFPERETTDAGATWHDYTSDYRQAAPIAPDLVFADPSVGYATVRGTIKRTVDGGAHWVSITTPGT